jgi:hypothetical protein
VPSERERGGLVGVKKTLVEAAPVMDPALEGTILPPEVTGQRLQPEVKPPDRRPVSAMPDDLTKPATFHLPLPLIQRLRATCRLKNTTMVEFVRQAIEEALERHRPTEEEIRRLLG